MWKLASPDDADALHGQHRRADGQRDRRPTEMPEAILSEIPFVTNNAHELSFAAEETAMMAKTVARRTFMANNCFLHRMQIDESRFLAF
jgi:hypothetical protein